jgi:glutaredoxin-like YruB-family protein
MEQKEVVVFSQPGCAPCVALKSFLKQRGIEYIEKDVSQDEAAVFELVRKWKSNTTPTVVIGDEVLIGFNPERIEQLLAK